MRVLKRNTFAALTLAAVATFGLAACAPAATDTATEPSSPAAEAPMDDYTGDLVGAGCAAYAEAVPDGGGSIVGMAQDPVAVAASNNPLLKTLVAAVSGQLNPDVNLVDTLNGSEFTVFAPVDDAFAKLPADTVAALMLPENAALLTSILTYHVVSGAVDAATVVGLTEATTLNGAKVSIKVVDGSVFLNDTVKVTTTDIMACNGIIHVIDAVLVPPAAAPAVPTEMPNTGAASQGLALGAGVLVLGGAGALFISRRRRLVTV